MDFTFSRDDAEFRDKARSWLSENVPQEPRPMEGPDATAFDKAWQRRQYDGGWAGIAWPKEYGGVGLSPVHQMIWHEEYARADAPPVGNLYIGLNHGGPTLIACGSEEQKAYHLPRILTGEKVWCQGFSEPGAGSDLAGLRTRGEIDGDSIVVNGSKIWTSFGHWADYQELLIRTNPEVKRHGGITWVICDMKLPGITIRPIINMAGLHDFNQVFYDNVRIPLANVVGGVNNGWRTAMTTFSFERGSGMVTFQVELAAVMEKMLTYARETSAPDGRPLIKDEEIAARLANLRAEIAALRSMTYMMISRGQRSDALDLRLTLSAVFHGELDKRVYRMAYDLLGPAGMARDLKRMDWQREYLKSFPSTIAGGTSEIRRNIIGERVLGLPRTDR